MIWVTDISLGLLAAGAVLAVVRLVRGPSIPDRVVALDTLLLLLVSGIAVDAARTRQGVFLDVLVVVALVGFVGVVIVARFIERRGAR